MNHPLLLTLGRTSGRVGVIKEVYLKVISCLNVIIMYLENIEEETFEGVRVKSLQSLVEHGINIELLETFLHIHFLRLLAVDLSKIVGRYILVRTQIAHIHLQNSPSLPPIPFLWFLPLKCGVVTNSDQTFKHAVGAQVNMLDSFIVDAHRC